MVLRQSLKALAAWKPAGSGAPSSSDDASSSPPALLRSRRIWSAAVRIKVLQVDKRTCIRGAKRHAKQGYESVGVGYSINATDELQQQWRGVGSTSAGNNKREGARGAGFMRNRHPTRVRSIDPRIRRMQALSTPHTRENEHNEQRGREKEQGREDT